MECEDDSPSADVLWGNISSSSSIGSTSRGIAWSPAVVVVHDISVLMGEPAAPRTLPAQERSAS